MPKSMILTETNKEIKDWKKDLLKSIAYSGKAENTNAIIIGNHSHLSNIVDVSNGIARINRSVVKKFTLILSKPYKLAGFDMNEIRCCLCKKIIHYPCWYYEVKYAVNHFHYFICFSSESKDKPNARCYKRG